MLIELLNEGEQIGGTIAVAAVMIHPVKAVGFRVVIDPNTTAAVLLQPKREEGILLAKGRCGRLGGQLR